MIPSFDALPKLPTESKPREKSVFGQPVALPISTFCTLAPFLGHSYSILYVLLIIVGDN
jgi:hypothetical protein